jgi:hypothetical protein
MTPDEQSAYKQYLFKMTDDQLDAETQTVIKQPSDEKALLIQFVYTEWLNRGKGERFVKAYNAGINAKSVDWNMKAMQLDAMEWAIKRG